MNKKKYVGVRKENGEVKVMVVLGDGSEPQPLKHVVCHSPTGFEFGYGGSGPADLSLSILCDHFEEDPTPAQIRSGAIAAWKFHQDFKWTFVGARVQGVDHFVITQEEIEEWLEKRRANMKTLENKDE